MSLIVEETKDAIKSQLEGSGYDISVIDEIILVKPQSEIRRETVNEIDGIVINDKKLRFSERTEESVRFELKPVHG